MENENIFAWKYKHSFYGHLEFCLKSKYIQCRNIKAIVRKLQSSIIFEEGVVKVSLSMGSEIQQGGGRGNKNDHRS